jgi:predicted metal-binding membrane protein
MFRSVSHSVRAAYVRLIALGPAPLSVFVSLMVLTAAAWGVTLYQALSMSAPMGVVVSGGMAAEGMGGMAMSGMSAANWSFAGLAVFVTVWTVMMIAMMLPAAAPMILIFASAQARRDRQVAVPTWIFVAGYILVWGAAGLIVYVLVQIAAELVSHVASLARVIWAPLALGAVLTFAGLYQFTPVKRVCLHYCRSPFGFVAQYWREGWVGALGMGLRHGLYCLGCCWALFAVLVAAGVMSLAWMLLLTLVVFAEKVLPHGPRTSAAVGVAFIALGVTVASGAISMPLGYLI